MLPLLLGGAALVGKSIYDSVSRGNAVDRANKALEKEKVNAVDLNSDTLALMNPNIAQQIQVATDAAMGQFGGSGNLYSSAARNAVADRAQAIASNEWTSAAQRAMAMRQNNKELTAAINSNKVANANNNPLSAILGRVGDFLATGFS